MRVLIIAKDFLQKSIQVFLSRYQFSRYSFNDSPSIAVLVPCARPQGENFGKYLKVGVVEDDDNKDELAGLCRFFSKNHDDSLVSFDEYVKEMKVSAAT